jgi:hypothetical protein
MSRKRAGRAGARFALIVRMLGATGLFVALLGLIPLATAIDLKSRTAWEAAIREFWSELPHPSFSQPDRDVGLAMVLVGGVVFLLATAILLLGGLRRFAARRNAVATNSALQTGLAVGLLVAINVWSFSHYERFDWTGKTFGPSVRTVGHFPYLDVSLLKPSGRFPQQFTLPDDIAAELRKLREPTTVVVYQRHKTFGQLGEKPDAYDFAAERKVVEKVQDLVEQFREFGPQFRVEVLDVESEDYDAKLDRLTRDAPVLKAAIDAAPDSSLLFYASREVGLRPDGKPDVRESVQRLSFTDFYQLDKTASLRQSNLVLLPQGVEPFARRILAINERKPRVGIAVIHELLSTEGYRREYTMAGVRKALESHGFEVTDIVLKKWGERELQPVAYTADENRLEGVEGDLAEIDESLQALQTLRQQRQAALERIRAATLDELTSAFRSRLGGRPFTEALRKEVIDDLTNQIETFNFVLKQNAEARQQLEGDRAKLTSQERVIEERRMTDVKAKMLKLLADCDLLIVPRMTQQDLTAVPPDTIAAQFYPLSDAQAEAIKEFMKWGRPVLACFGPANEPADPRMPGPGGPDALERALGDLGIQFGKQTVLFMSEGRAFAERRSAGIFGGAAKVDIPPVKFQAPPEKRERLFDPSALPSAGEHVAANPIAESMGLVARNLGPRQPVDLTLRHARPVYFVPVRPGRAKFAPEFLVSDDESWNEDQPVPTEKRTPRFEPPKADDPAKGTRDEKRRGPFPLAVAIETTVPAEWTDPKAAAAKTASLTAAGATGDPAAVTADGLLPADDFADKGRTPTPLRVAAIGHGGLFVGPDLSPARERLLLTTCNWLLGRDERLPHPAGEWEYPRVELSPRAAALWRWGTQLALPGAFAFLGILVLTARRYR